MTDRTTPEHIKWIWPSAPPPLKTIRAKCLECVGGSAHEVRECASTNCQLWHYRMGRNPYLTLSDAERERRAAVGRRNIAKINNP